MENFFFFVMGVGFSFAVVSLVIALCEDYYIWRKKREVEVTVLPPCSIAFGKTQKSKRKKRDAKTAVKTAKRK